MDKRFGVFFLTLMMSCPLIGQVLPKEGSKLNYRIIGFLFGGGKQTGKYTLEIARGNDATESDFNKNVILTLEADEPKVIAEVPSFGCGYTWRTIFMGKGKKSIKSALHHFSTGYCPAVDTAKQRLRILKQAEKYKDAYVFLDYCRVMYDMDGKPVWYLPDSTFAELPNDLKLTPQGTLTFLLGTGEAYEINYNGDVLWKGPNDGTVSGCPGKEAYHHQLTRLPNGNYMVLGNEPAYVLKHWPAGKGKEYIIADSNTAALANDTNYSISFFGTIIEYDHGGKVVWSWRFLKYFKGSDLYYRPDKNIWLNYDMHENAFFFDGKDSAVYISYRVCSRILKIAYPSGRVLAAYGEVFKQDSPEKKNGLFYGQHACNLSEDGNLYVFNNNVRDSTTVPQVVVMREHHNIGDSLEKEWQYDCTLDGVQVNKKDIFAFKTGGNVEELPDKSMFVTMSQPYCKVFIVSHDKKILWAALPEKWEPAERKWQILRIYRASIVYDRNALERLVWSQECEGGALQ